MYLLNKKINKNKKKAISLVILIVVVVIMLIISSVAILNFKDRNVTEAGNLATMQSNMQKMLDTYEVKYNELLVKYKGDNSKITAEDVEAIQVAINEIIPEDYQGKYQVTVSGISYIGDDDTEKKVATEMGMYVTDALVLE